MSTVVMPLIRTYNARVYLAEEGGYWGEVLELPGCVSQGETLEEFGHNIREAVEAILETQSPGQDHVEFQVNLRLAEDWGTYQSGDILVDVTGDTATAAR